MPGFAQDQNKMWWGFSRLYYALYKEGASGGIGTWSKPKPIPGAKGLAMNADGDTQYFAADDNANYIVYTADNGYTGELVAAMFPDDYLMDTLGYRLDKNGMMFEAAGAPQEPHALLFELQGNKEPRRVVLYHCIGSKPSKDVKSNEKAPQFEGEKMSMVASPIDFGWIRTSKGVMLKSRNETKFEKFFEEVQLPENPDGPGPGP